MHVSIRNGTFPIAKIGKQKNFGNFPICCTNTHRAQKSWYCDHIKDVPDCHNEKSVTFI